MIFLKMAEALSEGHRSLNLAPVGSQGSGKREREGNL